MATCPDGHESSTDDWCEVCGAPIAARPVATPTGGDQAAPSPSDQHDLDHEDPEHGAGTELLGSARQPDVPRCPACGAAQPSADRFCEHCGADLAAFDSTPAAWVAEVAADPALFDRVGSTGLAFPTGRPPRVVALSAVEVLIGRTNAGRGVEAAIDLSGALADPGASHRHALLTRLDDGSYTLTDLGSTNGTTLNEGQQTAEAGRAYPLADGDRIHVGAWTTITLRRRPD